MLKSLFIQNYALIDTLDIRFQARIFRHYRRNRCRKVHYPSVQSACCSVSARQ